MCCRWERVWGREPLFSCLPQRHGHLLLLLSARPHHLSWRQDLSGYTTHKHTPSCHWISTGSIIITQTAQRLNNSLLFVLVDIDECSLGGNVCHDGQDCENTIGSYRCVMRCGRGFRRTADGLSCTGTSASFIDQLCICCGRCWYETFVFFVAQMWTSARSPIRAISTVWTRLVATDAPASRAFNSGTDAV